MDLNTVSPKFHKTGLSGKTIYNLPDSRNNPLALCRFQKSRFLCGQTDSSMQNIKGANEIVLIVFYKIDTEDRNRW